MMDLGGIGLGILQLWMSREEEEGLRPCMFLDF